MTPAEHRERRRYQPTNEIEKLNQALHDERAKGRELLAENERLREERDRVAKMSPVEWAEWADRHNALHPTEETEEEARAEDWPEHLRTDAPPKAICSVCGRKSWDSTSLSEPCGMPQPSGKKCPGHFEPVSSDLPAEHREGERVWTISYTSDGPGAQASWKVDGPINVEGLEVAPADDKRVLVEAIRYHREQHKYSHACCGFDEGLWAALDSVQEGKAG